MNSLKTENFDLCVVDPSNKKILFETKVRAKSISQAVKSVRMQVDGELLVLQKAAVPSLNHLFSFENSVSHLNGVAR